MTEIKNQEEPILHAKRKPDLPCQEDEVNPNKIQKLQTLNNNTSLVAEENGETEEECEKENQATNHSSVAEANIDQPEPELAAELGEDDDEEDEEDYEGQNDVDDKEEDEDEDIEKSNGKAVADRKGKGKLIEEESDDDSDSDDDDGDLSESEAESDLSDDPLAEVDLDNILPSRTRRRAAQPGLHIANDLGNARDGDSDA